MSKRMTEAEYILELAKALNEQAEFINCLWFALNEAKPKLARKWAEECEKRGLLD